MAEKWLSITRVPSETRELSRSPVMMTNHAFQPEAVEALAAAFQKAWRFVSHDQHFAVVDHALLKRRLAACLMELSAEGEHDPLRLANSAVRRMRQESGQKLPVPDGATVFRRRRDIAEPGRRRESSPRSEHATPGLGLPASGHQHKWSFRQVRKIASMYVRNRSHPENSSSRRVPMQPWSPSGLQTVPHLQWGSHLAHFFGSGSELRDVLVPYFKAGLENNEQCLWVTGEAFDAEQARSALRAAVPDLDKRERDKQIEITDGDEWYATGGKLRPHDLLGGLLRREQDALGLGYAGLRTNGNCAGLLQDQWADFLEYETLVQRAVRGRRMICLCSYCMDQVRDGSHLEVMERHDLAVPSAVRIPPRRLSLNGAAVAVGHSVQDGTDEHELRQSLERQKRIFDLAMVASDMGTWRYTWADNVCVYDENAQRLYGLTEARFLHDEEGVKGKFHPDDLELMWARVAKALGPDGDGHYDVEYRVKQLDGGWRWLSAWGLVEFEGDGPERKPVAIVGASRDLTKLKQAEELQRLLLNELNHRVKNTLATIQAISAQTLRAARDLPSAREALDRRIRSLAQAHDLLTVRAWTGANLTDVVVRALDAFTPTQVKMSGTAIDVAPKHALALSLALHELATNAIKYGALSCPEGHVNVQWGVEQGMLHLDWEESGGPPVAPPTQRGFGSRLLEELIVCDLGGDTKLNYDASGVRCSITARL